jgi:ubiquinol-cytochrome c reductase cytochrome b subunit
MPANILQTPPEIVPLWYFTPFYSILRACTENFTHYWLPVASVVVAGLAFLTVKGSKVKPLAIVIPAVMILGLWTMQAKVWGVILMGASLMVFFALPYLDRSKVKSIRYRGWMTKFILGVFVVSFVLLGYLGTKSPDAVNLVWFRNVTWAQTFTLLYFAFFALMPWYTTLDKTKSVPDRVKK